MSEENIFREVDEELRREQIAAMWDKYGVFVLVGAALIIAIVGGYNFYNWWQDQRAAQSGSAYYEANQLLSEKKNAEALDAFAKLANDFRRGISDARQSEAGGHSGAGRP